MAWTASKIFVATIEDMLENTTAIDLNSDAFKVALYDNDITPSQTVTSANTAYGVDQWVTTGNEVSDGAEWPATGELLDNPTFAAASNVLKFDADDTVSTGTSATLANVYGCLIYDNTVTTPVDNQGISYHYFGGVNSVTDGTFTIVWHSSGIFTITL
jgi:hypothetical protein